MTLNHSLIRRMFCRSLVQFAFYLPVALLLGDPLFGVDGERLVLFQRSVFGSACFLLNYYSLAYVSISDASSIAFSAPVFVSLFACLLLREPCTPFQILTIITALIGVTMIARPAFLFPDDDLDRHFHRDERFVGTILSFATSLSMAYTFVLMRRLQKTPVSTVITYFSLFCIVAGALTAVLLNQIPDYKLHVPYDRRDYCLMLANGLCGVMGQAFLVISLKIELAGLVSLARTFDIVIAFLYQVTLLDQSATHMSIIGAAIVLISCAACACKKLTEAKPHLLPKFMSCMR